MGFLIGSVIPSFILGYAEVFTSFIIDEQLTELISLVGLVFVLIFKPPGIMKFVKAFQSLVGHSKGLWPSLLHLAFLCRGL